MSARWWRASMSFMAPGESREDVIQRLRILFDGMPLKDIRFSADPMNEQQILRALDRESAKAAIENDTDQSVRLIDMAGPPRIVHPYEQGLWIFPDGHPLAPYERLAAEQKDTDALDKLKELMPSDRPLRYDVGSVEEDGTEDVEGDA